MKNVIVLPWKGKYYSKTGYNGKKVMVLGESHYCKSKDECGQSRCIASTEEKCKSRTWMIKRYLRYIKTREKGTYENWFQTYTNFVKLFEGNDCDSETIITFWNSVLFYNYVQKPIKRKGRPTKEMFRNEDTPFFEIIKKYDPDIIFVWGKDLWHGLPRENFSERKTKEPNGYYNNGKRKIPAYCIDHPRSRAFNKNKSKWSRHTRKAINSI